MENVRVAAYASPTLVYLAFDLEPQPADPVLLGFAIRRTPGHGGTPSSYLPNALTFDGAAVGNPVPSDQAPIQKYDWWDAQIDDGDRGKTFTYAVIPVTGKPGSLVLQEANAASVSVTLPLCVDRSIGTWFNRAVVSSQAFAREFGPFIKDGTLTGDNMLRALRWLGNGMEQAVPNFIANTKGSLTGAIYHLQDPNFIIPALQQFRGSAEMVYDAHVVPDQNGKDTMPNQEALDALPKVRFFPRVKTAIMHDKFIVRLDANDTPTDVCMGSANYTTGGLSSQANVIHTWASPELAKLYAGRAAEIQDDPAKAQTARGSAWSDPISIDEASVSVFFSPEPTKQRDSIDAMVKAVEAAKSSVIFCVFDPTDQALRDAIFAAADKGLMMYGLVNKIPRQRPGGTGAAQAASIALYDRREKSSDVYNFGYFSKSAVPNGFWWEYTSLTGSGAPGPQAVFIHHKFVLIDAETDDPTVFVGSQNFSNNSVHNNDENLLEITKCPRLARIYLAEFSRLYDHYRARVQFERSPAGAAHMQKNAAPGSRPVPNPSAPPADDHANLHLAPDGSWTKKWFTPGTPNFKSRRALVGLPPMPDGTGADVRTTADPNSEVPEAGDTGFDTGAPPAPARPRGRTPRRRPAARPARKRK